MMTEEEAKTKWCPFARARGFASEAAINRPWTGLPQDHQKADIPDGECKCIGSACMAWRRRRWFWWPAMTIGEQWERKAMGRCGLAGAP